MNKYIKKLREENAFTLIEMLIVIMIVSLLLILVMTNVGGVQDTVKTTTDAGIIQTVESQMVIYKMATGEEATVQKLLDNKYIDDKQFKAYNEAKVPAKPKGP